MILKTHFQYTQVQHLRGKKVSFIDLFSIKMTTLIKTCTNLRLKNIIIVAVRAMNDIPQPM